MTRTTALFVFTTGLMACDNDINNQEDDRDGMVEQQDPGSTPGDSSNDPADDGEDYDEFEEQSDHTCWDRDITVSINPSDYGADVLYLFFSNATYPIEADGTTTFHFAVQSNGYPDHSTQFILGLDDRGMDFIPVDEFIDEIVVTNDGNDLLSMAPGDDPYMVVDIVDCDY